MPKVVLWKLKPSTNSHISLEQVDLRPAPATLNSASTRIPGGVYTTFRTYDRSKILPLEYQIQRLEESAELLQSPIELNEKDLWRSLRQARDAFPGGDLRVRLTIDLEQEPGSLYLALEPLRTPSTEEYENGVRTVTCDFQRDNPRSKRTTFIPLAAAFQRTLPPGVHEGLLLDAEGHILEGLSSNFFVVKDGRLWTAGEEVLSGITRSLVILAAGRIGVPIHFQSIPRLEVPKLSEAFLTSSSRSVLSVRQIDEQRIGDGEPGPVTGSISDAFWEELRSRLVEL